MIQTKEEMFLAEMGINAQATIEGDYTATYKLKDLLKEYAEQCNIADVSNRRELLTTFRTWWWGNREKATDITNNDLDRYLGG